MFVVYDGAYGYVIGILVSIRLLLLSCMIFNSMPWLASAAVSHSLSYQGVLGKWQSEFAHISIKKNADTLSATIIHVPSSHKKAALTHCTRGTCAGKALINLDVFRHFTWNASKERWEGEMLAAGWNGKWYKTHMWISEPNVLMTRSYIGLLFSTSSWIKIQ